MLRVSGYKQIKCLYCAKENEATASGRGFCSDRCRLAFERENRHQFFCFYCGLPAKESSQKDTDEDTVDPVCRECNTILRDVNSCCRGGLARVILDTYERKYEKILGQVEWGPEEMKGMGYNMKTAIRKTLQDKQILEDRTTRLRYTAKRHSCRAYER